MCFSKWILCHNKNTCRIPRLGQHCGAHAPFGVEVIRGRKSRAVWVTCSHAIVSRRFWGGIALCSPGPLCSWTFRGDSPENGAESGRNESSLHARGDSSDSPRGRLRGVPSAPLSAFLSARPTHLGSWGISNSSIGLTIFIS